MVEIDGVLLRKLREAGVISDTVYEIFTDQNVRERYQRFVKTPKISDAFKKSALKSIGQGPLVDLASLSREGKQELTAYRLAKSLLNHGQVHFVMGASDLYIQAEAPEKGVKHVNQITITWQPKNSDYTRIIKISTWYTIDLNGLENFMKAIIARRVLPHVANGKITIQEPNGPQTAVTSMKLLNTAIRNGVPLEAVISLT